MDQGINEIDRFGGVVGASKQGIVCIRRACIGDETAAVMACILRAVGVLSLLRISLMEIKTEFPCDLHIISTPKRTVVRQNITV